MRLVYACCQKGSLLEQLVEEGGHGVGERVAVHGGRQGVPLPAAAEGEFDVVVAPAGGFEVSPDVLAQVPLDFEDESGGPLLRVRGLPREQLLGEGAHADGGLAGPDGAEDGDPGIQAPLGEREPGWPPDFPRLGGVVDFPDHQRGRVVVRCCRPGRQGPAAGAPVPRAGAEPKAVRAGEDHDAAEGHDGRHQEVPGADDGVEAGVFERDEIEERNVAGRGEGTRCDGPREREEREKDGDDEPPAEQAVGRFGGAREAVCREGGRPAGGAADRGCSHRAGVAFPQGSLAPEARAGSDPESGKRGGKSRPFPGRPSRGWRGVAPSPTLRPKAETPV